MADQISEDDVAKLVTTIGLSASLFALFYYSVLSLKKPGEKTFDSCYKRAKDRFMDNPGSMPFVDCFLFIMTDEDFKKFHEGHIKEILPCYIRMMTPDKFSSFSSEQLTMLTNEQKEALPRQFTVLKRKKGAFRFQEVEEQGGMLKKYTMFSRLR